MSGKHDFSHAAQHNSRKLYSVKVYQPIEGLENRRMLAVDLSVLSSGLSSKLGTLDTNLVNVLYRNSVPLLGNSLKTQSQADFVSKYKTILPSAISGKTNVSEIRTAIFNALKTANLLGDYNGAGGLTIDDVQIVSTATKVQFGVLVSGTSAIDLSMPLNLALPGLAFRATKNIPLHVDLAFKHNLIFGVDTNGVFVDATKSLTTIPSQSANTSLSSSNLAVIVNAGYNADQTVPANVGLLHGKAVISSALTNFKGTFSFKTASQVNNLTQTGLLNGTSSASVGLAMGFSSDLSKTNQLASINATLLGSWTYTNADTASTLDKFGTLSNLEFKNVNIAVGSLVKEILMPYFQRLQNLTNKLQPFLDIFTARIPGISDLSELAGKGEVEVIDLLTATSPDSQLWRLVSTVINIVEKFKSINPDNINISLPLDGFKVAGLSNLNTANLKDLTTGTVNFNPTGNDITALLYAKQGTDVNSETVKAKLKSSGQSSLAGMMENEFAGKTGVKFATPLFDDPKSVVFRMLLGQQTDFINFAGNLSFNPSINIPYGIPYLFNVAVQGSFKVNAFFKMGYDTYGLQQLASQFSSGTTVEAARLLDGFYYDKSSGLNLSASLGVKATIPGFFATGGLTGSFLLKTHGNPPTKVRPFTKNFDTQKMFDVTGGISANIAVNFGIDESVFGHNLYTQIFSKSADLIKFPAGLVLGLGGFTVLPPPPVLAGIDSSNRLVLFMGSDAGKRKNIANTDVAEKYVVKPNVIRVLGVNLTLGVAVSALGYTQIFPNTFSSVLVNNAGIGDDFVSITGLTVPVTVNGGEGNDTVVVDTSGLAVLTGGIGNDQLTGGRGLNMIVGNDGNDQISGGNHATGDTLRGNAGADSIFGLGGKDFIFGDEGDDILDGAGGNDFVDGGIGNDVAQGGSGSDSVFAGSGNDFATGGSFVGSEAADATTTAFNDTVTGNDGDDVLYGDTGNDSIDGGNGADLIYGQFGNDTLTGGAANDTISGGESADSINGAGGNDFLRGDTGQDTITGDTAGDSLGGNDSIYGDVVSFFANGTIRLIASDGDNDVLNGMAGSDTIYGQGGNDLIRGDEIISRVGTAAPGGGNDSLFGGIGNDSMFGVSGDDVLNGDAGNDSLVGGIGKDKLFGGVDNDIIEAADGYADAVDGGIGIDTLLNKDLLLDKVTNIP